MKHDGCQATYVTLKICTSYFKALIVARRKPAKLLKFLPQLPKIPEKWQIFQDTRRKLLFK